MNLTSRERVRRTIAHDQPDRVPVHDSVWKATEDKWHEQGLPQDITAADFFDFDMAWFAPDVSLQFPYSVIEEDAEYITYQDQNGGIRRDHKDFTTTPQIIKTIIQEPGDWTRLKHRLQPNPERVNWREVIPEFKRHYNKDRYMVFCAATGYDWTQSIIDSEQLLLYILSEPELIKDIYRTHANLIIEMYEMMTERGFKFDGALLFCDMGYRRGLLFSPAQYLEQFHPVLKDLCTFFHSRGLQTILHSCGKVDELIPYFIEAGVDCLNPLEVKAGMDVVELKKRYGDQLAFYGGVDCRILESEDKNVIQQRIEEIISTANHGGGYIFGSDHSITTKVPFVNFKLACDLARTLSSRT